jgi:hypothetical protein
MPEERQAVDTGQAWMDGLPEALRGQRRILQGLFDFSGAAPEVRWLAVSCSLARGAGDRLSDVDAGIGAADGLVEEVARRILALDLGERVDVLAMEWPGGAQPLRRLFVQFADDSQLDLVVMPAGTRPGRAPDEVVLLDRDGLLAEDFTPGADRVDGEKVREWAFLGWVALADCAKYLERGSLWEAQARLQEARDRIWALWAAARGARYPVFGLSQVLDHDPRDLPPGIAGTVAELMTVPALRAAAQQSARVLDTASAAAAERCPTPLPVRLAGYVRARLEPR